MMCPRKSWRLDKSICLISQRKSSLCFWWPRNMQILTQWSWFQKVTSKNDYYYYCKRSEDLKTWILILHLQSSNTKPKAVKLTSNPFSRIKSQHFLNKIYSCRMDMGKLFLERLSMIKRQLSNVSLSIFIQKPQIRFWWGANQLQGIAQISKTDTLVSLLTVSKSKHNW